MSYDVLIENLRSAAGDYRTVATDLGADAVEINHIDPDSLGHVELAAWLTAVDEQCGKATTALHDGVTGLADSLDEAATYYESTDQAVGLTLNRPLGSPLLAPPHRPPVPPLYGPPAPLVYGPPAPTYGGGQ